MRCGKCKATGVSVAHVKGCYGVAPVTEPVPDTPAGPRWPASEKQINYVLGLQDERRLPDGYAVKDAAVLRRMERDDVSAEITLLKTFPHKDADKRGGGGKRYTMPAGRYAILEHTHHPERDGKGNVVNADIATGYIDSKWTFWQVDQPDKGRWKGYTFLKMLVGSPGDYKKVDVGRDRRTAVLDEIEKDPEKWMKAFGRQSGICGRCGSPLTNEDSLAAGIGPICAGKGF